MNSIALTFIIFRYGKFACTSLSLQYDMDQCGRYDLCAYTVQMARYSPVYGPIILMCVVTTKFRAQLEAACDTISASSGSMVCFVLCACETAVSQNSSSIYIHPCYIFP